MKVVVTYHKPKRSTVDEGESISINYLYIGTPEEIKSIEDFCREHISTALVMKSDTERG